MRIGTSFIETFCMPGVPRELAEHTLNVDPKFKPVKQFLRCFNEERRKAIGEEVARLLAAGFIIEVFHPEWLANPVLVLKKDQEKTTFITPFGAFCYVSMPFGLKSAQATYQRCVQNCLQIRLGAMFMIMWMILWGNPERRKL